MFNSKHLETKGEIQRLEAVNTNIKETIARKADAITNPSFASIADETLASVDKLKTEKEVISAS